MNTNTRFRTSQLVILGLMTAVLLLMAYTPLGYLNIGPLAITFNMIPVAVAAITLGPAGGAITGAVFGLTSFLQCIGVGGTSAMGVILFGINPVFAFIQRFVPRLLTGFLLGYIFRFSRKAAGTSAACLITGFSSAFLNTALFMGALVLLFGNSDYVQGLMGGRNVLAFICTFVGVNAVCEMAVSTVITGAVATALYKAHFIPAPRRTSAA
ncbi:MAG TPA: ECF transporter S component [Candidatus Choladousia intestinipullorum]|nr:ECF transporter S component [Candidatus Choladousia intestinipullorum]